MWKLFSKPAFLFQIFFLLCAPKVAVADSVSRHILAVIDSTDVRIDRMRFGDTTPMGEAYSAKVGEGQVSNDIAEYVEMPLNHLGFIVDYVDATQRLPNDVEMQQYDAITTWFQDNRLKGAVQYGEWITRQLEKGKKLIVMGEFGFGIDENNEKVPEEILQKFFKAFSVSVDFSDETESPLLIEATFRDPNLVGFERDPTSALPAFLRISPMDKDAKVFLKLKRRDTKTTGDVVFIHSKGGFVLQGYAIYQNPGDFQSRWIINPFRFFAKALGANFPKPDVTTLNGSRIFMSHIDGDGINSMSRLATGKGCGEMAYEKILTKYQLPVSVSVIVGDIISARGQEKSSVAELIKKIFALPNVQPASHGWAHPLIWSRAKRKMAFKLPGYSYSPQNEIGNSIAYINKRLVPNDKKTDLFFWTGDCRPDGEALAFVEEHGIRSINGGDTQFTNNFPSYTYVAPLFHHVGDLLQNFSADANEILYTNIWNGPYYGFRYAIDTYKRTESPIRVKPVDIYYHFFSLERESSFEALRQLYDWAVAQDIAPIFVSDYIDILQGFLTTSIEAKGPGVWLVKKNRALKTVRIDDALGNVDMARSKGVLGFTKHQGSLYIHLDNGKESEIVLTSHLPSRPYLVKASGKVRGWKLESDGVDFDLLAMGEAKVIIGGLLPKSLYTVTLDNKSLNVVTYDDGQIMLSEDGLGNKFKWVTISLHRGK